MAFMIFRSSRRNLFTFSSLRLHHAQKCLSRPLATNVGAGIDLSGVFTPFATPFNVEESIAYDKLKENFDKWNTTSLRGYLVEGTNGEVALLSAKERVDMVAKTRALVPKDKLLLAGSGCEGTLATMRMCDEMANAGADALMVVSPGYYKAVLNDRALIYHFTAVADQSPLPVILYTVPACTGVELSVSAVATLCQHPNIVGMKDSTGDITKLASFVAVSKGEQFQVLGGSAGFLLAALSVGCSGAVCALGNLLPHQVCQLYQYFTRSNSPSETPPCNEDSKQQVSLGDKFTASQKEHELLPSGSSNGKQTSLENKIECARKALQLQHELLAPNTAVTKTFGIAGLKQAMDWMGYYGGPARKPLMPLLDADRQALRNIFVKSGFLKD